MDPDYDLDSRGVGTVTADQVCGFFGEYRWLSNFYPCQVTVGGVTFASSEHAYQALKWPQEAWAQFSNITAAQAKKLGRQAPRTAVFAAIKDQVMRQLLVAKFTQNPALREKLLATGDRYLEETNWWGDIYWGSTPEVKGLNKLGYALMSVRVQLRSEATP